MDIIKDYLIDLDYVSLGLVALPIVAIVVCSCLLMGRSKTDDTMQRNGSKASQHPAKSHHQHQQHQQQQQHASKHDSSDSGLSTTGSQQASKTRRGGRSSAKRGGGGDSGNASSKSASTPGATATAASTSTAVAAAFSVDDWLGREVVFCYERRFMASCAEDNLMPRHHPAHRNSTSSDLAASDDQLHSSSSNEDLSAAYHALAKGAKKPSKSRQRRQQKRKQQTSQGGGGAAQDASPMDVDEELKENRRPPTSNGSNHSSHNNGGSHSQQQQQQQHQQQQQATKAGAGSLRKQCTKAAALKQLATTTKGAKVATGTQSASPNAHPLTSSPSASSVCSSLSSASSTCSIPSSLSSSANSSPAHSAHSSPTASPTISKRSAENFKKIARALAPPLRQHTKLNLSEPELVQHLRRYLIDPNLLRVYGYPVESAIHEGCVEIYKCLPKPFTHHHQHQELQGSAKSVLPTTVINANDGLHAHFPPSGASGAGAAGDKSNRLSSTSSSSSSADSGQGSGDSSPPSVDSDASEAGEGEDEPATTTAFYTPDGSYQIFSQYDQSLEKQCVRCKSAFHVTETGEYLSQEECVFHWGKLNHMYTGSKGFGYQYSCCQGDQASEGCSRNRLHVWTGAVVGINGPYTDFVHTRPRSGSRSSHGPTKVYALDCEMSFTGRGLEVTKVTVVGFDGQLVYEHFVRPETEIVDYNTRFSGITAHDLSSQQSGVKSLAEVQRDLLQLIDAETILIGHGLDNDLRVLRIVHKTIIDTSIAFPHASGFPYRRALKHLTKVCLNRDIQCGDAGHSSFEDSRACLELMLWKVRKEMRHGPDWTH